MALHKKQEAICLELGNRGQLAYCYCNWGLVARLQNDPITADKKLAAALSIFTELGMVRERDAVRKAIQGPAVAASPPE